MSLLFGLVVLLIYVWPLCGELLPTKCPESWPHDGGVWVREFHLCTRKIKEKTWKSARHNILYNNCQCFILCGCSMVKLFLLGGQNWNTNRTCKLHGWWEERYIDWNCRIFAGALHSVQSWGSLPGAVGWCEGHAPGPTCKTRVSTFESGRCAKGCNCFGQPWATHIAQYECQVP